MMRRVRSAGARLACVGVVVALGILTGCATLPPATPPGPAGPARVPGPRGAPGTPSSAESRPGRATAAPDTVPSPEARGVLATIPEPLAPGERVPPPAVAPGRGVISGPAATPAESTETAAGEPETSRSEIPVPTPTPVLGERPLPQVVSSADTSAPASAPPAGLLPPPPANEHPRAGAARGGHASRDTCWRVQIAAPSERAKAQRYLEAGQSQLLVPLVIEKENGLFKVRTRDCLGQQAADVLKRRALDAGFTGVFRVRGREP